MAAIDYKNARVFASLQRVVKDIDNNLRLVDIVDTDTIAASYVANDVVLCAETGTCIGVSMAALSFYKHNGSGWALLSYTTQEVMSKRTQKFDTDGNATTPIEMPTATAGNHPITKGVFDSATYDLAEANTANANAITDEATTRENADLELEQEIDTLKGAGYGDNPKTIEQIIEGVIIPPTYTAPAITNLSLSPAVIEVGAEETIRMSWTYNTNDGGAPDYPNAVFLFDSDEVDRSGYINGNSYFDFEFILFGAPAIVGMNVEIPYAEGPIKNDLTFGDPYPTGRIPSWFAAAAVNMEGKYYSLYGSALTLPDGSTIRNYDKAPDDQYTIIIGASDTVSFVFVPTGKSLVSIIDTSNLNADLTNDYQVQAMVQAPDAGGTNFSGVYYALFFSPYGAETNHVVTIQ